MRHPRLGCALTLLLLAISGCSAHELTGRPHDGGVSPTHWAELSIRPSLAQRITETIVHVGDLPSIGREARMEHWLRKTTMYFGGARNVQWTDTRRCAGAHPVLSNMYALEVPRPTEGGVIEVRADGVVYGLSTDGSYSSGRRARLSISSSGGTPLADWAERSMAELEVCWSDLPPVDIRR